MQIDIKTKKLKKEERTINEFCVVVYYIYSNESKLSVSTCTTSTYFDSC